MPPTIARFTSRLTPARWRMLGAVVLGGLLHTGQQGQKFGVGSQFAGDLQQGLQVFNLAGVGRRDHGARRS